MSKGGKILRWDEQSRSQKGSTKFTNSHRGIMQGGRTIQESDLAVIPP